MNIHKYTTSHSTMFLLQIIKQPIDVVKEQQRGQNAPFPKTTPNNAKRITKLNINLNLHTIFYAQELLNIQKLPMHALTPWILRYSHSIPLCAVSYSSLKSMKTIKQLCFLQHWTEQTTTG